MKEEIRAHSMEDTKFKCIEIVHQSVEETPYDYEVAKLGVVHNPEFEKINEFYIHPVFFRSVAGTFADQGYLDLGRTQVPFGSKEELIESEMRN